MVHQEGQRVVPFRERWIRWCKIDGTSTDLENEVVRPHLPELYKVYQWFSTENPLCEVGKPMELVVVLEGYPYTKMRKLEADELCRRLNAINAGESVKFDTRYENGAVIFTCSNEETKIWLKDSVPKLENWPYDNLEVGPVDIVVHGIKFVFSLNQVVKSMRPHQILNLIETQNDGISTKDWNVVERSEDTLTVWVDIRTLNALKASRLKLRLGTRQIEFKPLVSLTKMTLAGAQSIETIITEKPGQLETKLAVVKPICSEGRRSERSEAAQPFVPDTLEIRETVMVLRCRAQQDNEKSAIAKEARLKDSSLSNFLEIFSKHRNSTESGRGIAREAMFKDTSLSQILESISKSSKSAESENLKSQTDEKAVSNDSSLSQFLETVSKSRKSTETDNGRCAEQSQTAADVRFERSSLSQILKTVSKPRISPGPSESMYRNPDAPTDGNVRSKISSLSQYLEAVSKPLDSIEPDKADTVDWKSPPFGETNPDLQAPISSNKKYENSGFDSLREIKNNSHEPQQKYVDVPPSRNQILENFGSDHIWSRRPQVQQFPERQPVAWGSTDYYKQKNLDVELRTASESQISERMLNIRGPRELDDSKYAYPSSAAGRRSPRCIERQSKHFLNSEFDGLQRPTTGARDLKKSSDPPFRDRQFSPWVKSESDKEKYENLNQPTTEDGNIKFLGPTRLPERPLKSWESREFNERCKGPYLPTTCNTSPTDFRNLPFSEKNFEFPDRSGFHKDRGQEFGQLTRLDTRFETSSSPLVREQWSNRWNSTESDRGKGEDMVQPSNNTGFRSSGPPPYSGRNFKPWEKAGFDKELSEEFGQPTHETRFPTSSSSVIPERQSNPWDFTESNKGTTENQDQSPDVKTYKGSCVPPFPGRHLKPWDKTKFDKEPGEELSQSTHYETRFETSSPPLDPEKWSKPWDSRGPEEGWNRDRDRHSGYDAKFKSSGALRLPDTTFKLWEKSDFVKEKCEKLHQFTSQDTKLENSGSLLPPEPDRGRSEDQDQKSGYETKFKSSGPPLSPDKTYKPLGTSEFDKEKCEELGQSTLQVRKLENSCSVLSSEKESKPSDSTESCKETNEKRHQPPTDDSRSFPERSSKPSDKAECDDKPCVEFSQSKNEVAKCETSGLPLEPECRSKSSNAAESNKGESENWDQPRACGTKLEGSNLSVSESSCQPSDKEKFDSASHHKLDQSACSDSKLGKSDPFPTPWKQSKTWDSADSDKRKIENWNRPPPYDTRFKGSEMPPLLEKTFEPQDERGFSKERHHELGWSTRFETSSSPRFQERWFKPWDSRESDRRRNEDWNQPPNYDKRFKGSDRPPAPWAKTEFHKGSCEGLDLPKAGGRMFEESTFSAFPERYIKPSHSREYDEGKFEGPDDSGYGDIKFKYTDPPYFPERRFSPLGSRDLGGRKSEELDNPIVRNTGFKESCPPQLPLRQFKYSEDERLDRNRWEALDRHLDGSSFFNKSDLPLYSEGQSKVWEFPGISRPSASDFRYSSCPPFPERHSNFKPF